MKPRKTRRSARQVTNALVNKDPSMVTRAVSVLRVSTKKQFTDGDGIENQRRGNEAYLTKKGYKLMKEFVLAETADNKDRGDFDQVCAYLVEHRREVDVVIFWKLDRLSRGGVGAYYALKAYLARHAIRIEFATENIDASPSGELMESILAATARFENRLRVDRTIGVEKILTQQGYWVRAAPIGFKNARDRNGKPILAPDPAVWHLLQDGFRRQMTGHYKPHEVVKYLNSQGFRTRKGKLLSQMTWYKLCRNPLYGGYLRGAWTDGQLIRTQFDGPLTETEWLQLQKQLECDRALVTRLPKKLLSQEFPLRRFLTCPACNKPVRGYETVKKTGHRYGYYDCQNPTCRFRVPTAQAHARFVDLLAELVPSPEVLQQFRRVVLHAWESNRRSLQVQLRNTRILKTEITQDQAKLAGLMKEAHDNPRLLKMLRDEYEKLDRQRLLESIDECETQIDQYDVEAVIGSVSYFLENANELWEKWPAEGKTRLQVMFFPDGLSYEVLEGRRTAKTTAIHDVLGNLQNGLPMAAPDLSSTNYLLSTLVLWHQILVMEQAASSVQSARRQ